jgi:drug/metabolite transporter (DMT)-like permease
MTVLAVTLIFIAALLHAAWNTLGKKQSPSAAFFVIAMAAGFLMLVPCLIYYADKLQYIPSRVWLLICFTGVCQAFYFAMLAAAYRKGDMSLAYPLARALPVMLITMLTLMTGRKDQLSMCCLAGVVLIIGGCWLLPLRSRDTLRFSSYMNGCCACAALAALGTAGYSYTDDVALRTLRSLEGAPMTSLESALIYSPLEILATMIALLMWVLWDKQERAALATVWQKTRVPAALVGVGIYASYTLVLASLAHAQNVSYVMACRQISIPIGAGIGVLLFREPQYFCKIAGVITVFAGVVLVALG